MPYDYHVRPSSSASPPRLTIATCQFAVTSSVRKNAATILKQMSAAKAAGADVAHFPECALSGYGGEAWPSWEGFDWRALEEATIALGRASRRLGLAVVVGSVAAGDGASVLPQNVVHVIDGEGARVGTYAKRRCSANDLRAFSPGDAPLIFDLHGVRCTVLICLEWSYPELWAGAAAEDVELVFHSAFSAGHARGADRIHQHVISPLMQGYAFVHVFAISASNCSAPQQDYASHFVERTGHRGGRCRRSRAGLVINAIPDDAEQDRFFEGLRGHRRAR